MEGRSAHMRRWAIVALLFGAVVLIGSQTPASALDLSPCNNTDAPIPASPYGDGSLGVKVGDADADADPFESPDEVTLESVYGTAPQLWTYDNGCTGQFIAEAGTAFGNILLQISGLLPNWSHVLLEATVSPDSPVRALDNPVVEATNAVTDAVWKPWLSVVLLIVVVVILNRARSGRLAHSLHAAAWAGLVLVVTSWMTSYPTESVKLVDDGVRLAVTNIAFGFDDRPGGEDADPAVAAVAGQMDEIVRSTQYRAWLTGALGDPDSETAKSDGADLFRATHFSFPEYDTYRKDPDGEGKEVLEAKQKAFKELAEKIERDDPRAYDYFTGEHWSQRATTGLINLVLVAVTCGFLLAAGLAILMSFVLIRLLVPFAPAAGTLFMIDHTRDMAVSWLRRVVGPLVMGPILFLIALVLLRLFTAVLSAPEIWYIAKFAIIGVLTAIACWAVKPTAYGIGHVRAAAGTAWGFASGWHRTVTPYLAPARQVQEPPGIPPRPTAPPPPSPPSARRIEAPAVAAVHRPGSGEEADVSRAPAAEDRIRRLAPFDHVVHHVVPNAPSTPLGEIDRAQFAAYMAELHRSGKTRRTEPGGAGIAFQHVYCGEYEYRLSDDGQLPRATWADDLDADFGMAVDAKEITADGSSFYSPETIASPFMRKIAEEKNDHRLAKYHEAIKDEDSPVSGLEILTNSSESAQYFLGRMRALGIPGRVVVVPGIEERDEE